MSQSQAKREQVLVDKEAFMEVISIALSPHGYLMREIQAIKDFPNTPLYILKQDWKRIKEEGK